MRYFYFLFLGFCSLGFSQTTIYSEDFSGQNGLGYEYNYGTGTLDFTDPSPFWSINLNGSVPDFFKVIDEQFVAEYTDAGGDPNWLSPVIDINGYSNVSFSLDAFTSNNLENADFFRVQYRINGGTWTFASNNGNRVNDFNVVVSQSGLSGNTLQIRITTRNDVAERHTFDNILITGILPPSNDLCANATPINCGDTVTGNTTNATNSDGLGDGDVFYSLAGTSLNEEITISLCGSSFDTFLEVFDACSGNSIVFNDDSCGTRSEVTFTSDGVTTYIIQVDGFGAGDSGDFTLDVSCVPPPCGAITGLTLDSATATSATISWTAAGSETAWEIAVQADGTGIPGLADNSGTNTSTNPYTESGLSPSTAYEVYVRAECTAGTDFGEWVGPLDFTTPCAESAPLPVNNPTPSNGDTTVPIIPFDGQLLIAPFAWEEDPASNTADSYTLSFGITPAGNDIGTFNDFSSGDGVFYAWTENTTYYWYVSATNCGGTTQSPVWSFTTAPCTDTSPPACTNLLLPVNNDANVTTSLASDGSRQVNLSWEPIAGALAYNITFDGINLGDVLDTNVNIFGLDYSTTYTWSISPINCFGTATGCTTFTFTTEPCEIITTFPFEEGFEDAAFPPQCWSTFRGANGLGTGFDWERTTAVQNYGSAAAFVRYENVTGGLAEDWLVTPALDLSSLTSPELSFYAAQQFTSDFGSVYTIRISTSNTDIASFTTVQTYTEADLPLVSVGFDLFTVDLSSYNNESIVYIAFVMTNDDGDNFFLDDIKVEDIAPIVFTFNGTWTPYNPNGLSEADDDIVIASGNAMIDTNTICNTVIINPGATLTVDIGATLTVDDSTIGLTLQSVSDNYSSLLLNGTIDGTVNYQRFVNVIGSGTTSANDLVSAPLSGQTFGDFAAANNGVLAASGNLRAWAPFNNTSGTYQNYNVVTNANTVLEAGMGYRAATTGGDVLNFTGTVETGTVSRNITVGPGNFKEWNLIGNPYTAYISMEAFLQHEVAPGVTNLSLLDNASGIYGYDGTAQNGWDVVSLANATGRFMAPGQGFFVAADEAQVGSYDIEFTPDMRVVANGDDFIPGRTAPLTYLKLEARRGNQSYQTQFYFNVNAGNGLDAGYDAQTWGGTSSGFILYSHLVADNTGVPMALQALHPDALNEVRIPLGINASSGNTIIFSIAESQLPAGTEVYLEDTVNNSFTLLNQSNYQVTLQSGINGTGRFFLRFGNGTLSNNDVDTVALNIYHQPATATVVIAGLLQHNSTAYLYDLQGRMVRSAALNTAAIEQHVDVSGLSSGVYVLSFEQNGAVVSKKLVLKP